ncbi:MULTISPECIES: hypothetical protein [unclassified Legionella]|uniref:hypothetical protein n=1 Tax=unclassified Legionella TaxID=2622702 RepID=UPI0010556106|nr:MULTISPECIES: hypothetical protein [unclassified Legionella]MDI9819113.1 hypothetical protein [Legionella sp. PL877]
MATKRNKSNIGIPTWPPLNESGTKSILAEETPRIERERRVSFQETLSKKLATKIHARDHQEKPQTAPEGELQNSIMQHPWQNSQRNDGIDPNLSPEPPLNTEAHMKYENERREQEMEKQLRLGLAPKMKTAPEPSR